MQTKSRCALFCMKKCSLLQTSRSIFISIGEIEIVSLIFNNESSTVSREIENPGLNKEFFLFAETNATCVRLSWKRYVHRSERKPRVSLDERRPQICSRAIRLLARQRINYAHFIRVFTQMERTKAAWGLRTAASNGVAKTGCAARRRIASLRAHETHMWTVLTHFAAACIHRARPFKQDRSET